MTSLLNMCSNCGKYEVAKTQLCGFNDWCEECDISLWSTANEVATNIVATTTTTKDEELDYFENLPRSYVVNDHRPKGAKWCTQKCLDSYNIKHPIMVYCKECYLIIKLGDFCKICS